VTDTAAAPPAPLSTPPATATATGTPAEQRGVTEFTTQVVEKLALRLATEVQGVVDRPITGLRGALPGRAGTSTTADAEVGRSTTRVALQLDVRYPSPVCEVVEQVRSHVREGLERLTGLRVTRLDVTVRHIVGERPVRARVS
jgi:uncharacterized alkaline shock family protein YloU